MGGYHRESSQLGEGLRAVSNSNIYDPRGIVPECPATPGGDDGHPLLRYWRGLGILRPWFAPELLCHDRDHRLGWGGGERFNRFSRFLEPEGERRRHDV